MVAFVIACGTMAGSGVSASQDGQPAASSPQPNVVLILADDLGWADLGCYGNPYHKTPRLDALAKQGIRCTQAYADCPVCSPTRAALLTGQHPARMHLTDWLPGRGNRPDQALAIPEIRQSLPEGISTFPGQLRDHGYVTCSIGKWHLGGKDSGPLQHGFVEQIAGDERGSPAKWFAPFGPQESDSKNTSKVKKARGIPGLEDV
ncbi:MAG: arylsulfatase, partial [Planctomyces sp.]|nr:arylsulfatase [Planctomyces sp.]